MRFVVVSTCRGSFAVSSNFRSDDKLTFGFPIVLLEELDRIRFRSVQFGEGTLVCLRLHELDNLHIHPSNGPLAPHESLYILVASDEGLTETTLLRIAALVQEMCILLDIDNQRSGTNRELLQRFLWYVDQRMALNDLIFLTQSLESLQVAVLATGRSNDPNGLLDELMGRMLEKLTDTEQAPGYAAVMFGDKLVMRTNEKLAEDSCHMNEVENYILEDADRYLLHLLTAAFFAAPGSYVHVEQQLLKCERHLEMLGINRTNVLRDASRNLLARYCAVLRAPKGANHVSEEATAVFYETAFETLRDIAEGKFDSLYHLPSGGGHVEPHREPEYLFVNSIAFRTGYSSGRCHLLWAPIPEQQGEMSSLSKRIPHGYGMCLVYFPPLSEKEQRHLSAFNPVEVTGLENLVDQVSANLEHVYNSVCWLLHPPVESYKTPGLICFVRVDRKTNTAVCSSFEEMSDRKPTEVRLAVAELKRTMAQCISKSQDLISRGYSEGLWGNLAMQFFYMVGVTDPNHGTTLPGGALPGGKSDAQGQSNAAAGSGGAGSILFNNDGGKKLPDRALEQIVLRPMLLADMVRNVQIVEIYAMFLGCMSPAEVCAAAELLQSKLMAGETEKR